MIELKQSTALTVPFFAYDANGDGVTGIADGSWTKRISKNGAAFGAMTVTISELENGWYSIPLSTSHTDTLGALAVSLSASGVKRVNLLWRVTARITDDLATQASVDTIDDFLDTEIAAIKAKTDSLPASPAATGDIPSAASIADAVWDEAQSGHTSAGTFGRYLDAQVANVEADTQDIQSRLPAALVSGRIAADAIAISGSTTAADNVEANIGNLDATVSSRLATSGYTVPPSAATVADAVWDEATTGHTTSGTFGEQLKTDVDAILADTAELQTDWVDGGRLDTILDARASQASVNTIDDFLDTEIAAIISTLGTPAGASVSVDLADIEGKIDDLEGRLTATRAGYLDNLSGGAVALASGVTLTNSGIDAILDRANGVETGYTVRQVLRLMAAALLGELSGAATTTITIRDIGDTKTRVTATVDSDGNRSAVSYDAS